MVDTSIVFQLIDRSSNVDQQASRMRCQVPALDDRVMAREHRAGFADLAGQAGGRAHDDSEDVGALVIVIGADFQFDERVDRLRITGRVCVEVDVGAHH